MTQVTWWGHSFAIVDFGGVRVATDPLAAARLFHLRRATPVPPSSSLAADVVLVSHLHHDHLHVPTLQQFSRNTPIVVPAGARQAVRELDGWNLVEAEPGDRLTLHRVSIEVLPAHHDGRRLPVPRAIPARAMGFRFAHGNSSVWYPGDTGEQDFRAIESVDLALVPIGGWGPTLGVHHLNPRQAADAVAQVGARTAIPVHYGTFWPIGLEYFMRSNHDHLFRTPAERFTAAVLALRTVGPSDPPSSLGRFSGSPPSAGLDARTVGPSDPPSSLGRFSGTPPSAGRGTHVVIPPIGEAVDI